MNTLFSSKFTSFSRSMRSSFCEHRNISSANNLMKKLIAFRLMPFRAFVLGLCLQLINNSKLTRQ